MRGEEIRLAKSHAKK